MKRNSLEELIRRTLLAVPVSMAAASYSACGPCPSQGVPLSSLSLVDGGPTGGVALDSVVDAGALPLASCAGPCGTVGLVGCALAQSPGIDGGTFIVCTEDVRCVGGRRPRGLRVSARSPATAAGAYLARLAHLEAASVVAFQRLATDLARFEAPARLVKAAQRAAGDEVRHARAIGAHACRHGASPAEVELSSHGDVGLMDLAIENSVEGCVGETYGAIVAAFQSRRAGDPGVRASMRRIANDERRHAELAWDIAAWVEAKLPRRSGQQLRKETRRAADELAQEATRPLAPDVAAPLGLPSAAEARAMIDVVASQLWA